MTDGGGAEADRTERRDLGGGGALVGRGDGVGRDRFPPAPLPGLTLPGGLQLSGPLLSGPLLSGPLLS
ncbi:hypothetical protein LWC33_29060, partial [Pseudonocardia sp. RS11V-5]|uniref:hypothetical protein n=1 Tax=Pseudonocardia terrae TaxID=2905831 RepID=UPI001E4E33F1